MIRSASAKGAAGRFPTRILMRHLILSIITATTLTFAITSTSTAQTRASGDVQAITPCELYAESEAPICMQVMIPLKTTLSAVLLRGKGSRKAVLLRSDEDGHLIGTFPRAGRYRLTLRKVETSAGSFDPNTLKITPNNIRVSARPSPTLLLVSHRTRPTFNVGIAYRK